MTILSNKLSEDVAESDHLLATQARQCEIACGGVRLTQLATTKLSDNQPTNQPVSSSDSKEQDQLKRIVERKS